MSNLEVFIQQCITGLSNGLIIALVALGYTMVYGIIELINFAHGDLFMLGSFLALTIVGLLGADQIAPGSSLGCITIVALLITVPCFCAGLNFLIDRLAYRPLRNAPRLAPLVSAIGVSFILLNIGLFWGGLPMRVFGGGIAAAAPKDFPALISSSNLLWGSQIQITYRDLLVLFTSLPLMLILTIFVLKTRAGKAMRAVAQNPIAAQMMGIDVEKVIGRTFMLGGFLAGFASIIYVISYNTVFFQMGFRVGIDAFTAAVVGGIGSLPGALVGGVILGLLRAMSDQYLETQWTNIVVFAALIVVLIFRPSGLLGSRTREKV